MKDYLLVYRIQLSNIPDNTPEEIQASMQRWMEWMNAMDAKNKLVSRGNRLENSGRVVQTDKVVTNGPFTEIKESIGGYSIIKAESYEEAAEMAKGCPVLIHGGNVEVREIRVQ